MLVQHLDNKIELDKLLTTKEEMYYCYNRCIECNNIIDAKEISKRIRLISLKIARIAHKIEFAV